ncbi:MAG: hypothetical protein IPP46_09700 [Bacteroidetes bacterium]|nr:hypothetical protein [Bacteroidota bacterium]
MQFRLFIVALCFLSASLKAQPVFDVFQFQYQYSNPTTLLNKPEGRDAVLNFFQSQLNLPVKISPRDVLVLNPSYERRRINTGSNNLLSPHGPTYKELDFQSLSFTVSHQHTFSDTTAQLLAAAAIRHYADIRLSPSEHTLTPAFALLYSKRTSQRFAWKLGAYYSKEFFGNLWLPLVGFDWKISNRLWCWGILPRYAVMDYTITPYWHSCINYKGVTDSYRLPEEDWFSIVEGQLRWSNDFYIPRTGLMMTVDVGHSIARKFTAYEATRFSKDKSKEIDGFILRAAIVWRVVLNKSFSTPASTVH